MQKCDYKNDLVFKCLKLKVAFWIIEGHIIEDQEHFSQT